MTASHRHAQAEGLVGHAALSGADVHPWSREALRVWATSLVWTPPQAACLGPVRPVGSFVLLVSSTVLGWPSDRQLGHRDLGAVWRLSAVPGPQWLRVF